MAEDKFIFMTTFQQKSRVVCFGRDLQLLRTRFEVLARTYDAAMVSSVEELANLPAEPAFQVIMLCHTLSAEESLASTQIARCHWPQAKIMALKTGYSGVSSARVDAVVMTAEGPAVLLRSIDQMIRRNPSSPATQSTYAG